MGKTVLTGSASEFTSDGSGYCTGNIYGTYVHGLFDTKEIAAGVIDAVAKKAGKRIDTSGMIDMEDVNEKQYDALADVLRQRLDIDIIYALMGIENDKG